MNCSRAQGLISCVIDGAATEHQRRLLDFHLLGCPACRKAYRMSVDLSGLTRELPDPSPPEDLEVAVRSMLAASSRTPDRSRRIRASLLTVPAVAALIVLAMTVSPFSPENSQVARPDGFSQVSVSLKSDQEHASAKSRVRTAPLSSYSRQASLISF